MRRTTMALVAVAAMAVLVLASGCTRVALRDPSDSRTTVETDSVPLDAAKRLDAVVTMGVGELHISGDASATQALEATFTYAPVDWKPDVSYRIDGETGRLDIEQPDTPRIETLRDATSRWDLVLSGAVPSDLRLVLGVGKSDVDLREIDVRDLHVTQGVGDATIDLTGPRTSDVGGRIEAGVGNLRIRLPRSVPVRVNGREEGLGSFSADGFVSRGDSWENEAWQDATGPKIELDLTRGVGNVTLVLVD